MFFSDFENIYNFSISFHFLLLSLHILLLDSQFLLYDRPTQSPLSRIHASRMQETAKVLGPPQFSELSTSSFLRHKPELYC